MADEKNSKQALYEAIAQHPEWTGQNSLFGFLGEDHFGAEVFTDYLYTVKIANGGVLNLSSEMINPAGFLKFLKYRSFKNEAKYSPIISRVEDMISKKQMNKENFTFFAQLFDDLGIVDNRAQLNSRYETAIQSAYTENSELFKSETEGPTAETIAPLIAKVQPQSAQQEQPQQVQQPQTVIPTLPVTAPTKIAAPIKKAKISETSELTDKSESQTRVKIPDNVRLSAQEERIIMTPQAGRAGESLRKKTSGKRRVNRVNIQQLKRRRQLNEQQQIDQQNFAARQQGLALAEQAQARKKKKKKGSKIGRRTAIAAGGGVGFLSLISGQAASAATASDFSFDLIQSIINIIV